MKVTSREKNETLKDSKIYTLGGEIFSSITHGIAAAASVTALVILVVFAAKRDAGAAAIFGIIIFGICAAAGYVISTVYHALAVNTGKRVMRVLDHCSIYWTIAGTYTPFCIIAMDLYIGLPILIVNWVLCIVGTTLTGINRKKFHKFAFISYLVMGWLGVIGAYSFIKHAGIGWSFWLLLAGGIAYTVGAGIYKMKGKYTHGIWHLFTFAGLMLHFFSILHLII